VSNRVRTLLAALAAAAIVLPLGWLWQDSVQWGTYSVMDMGVVDRGGPNPPDHHTHHSHGGVGIDTLTDPAAGKAEGTVARAGRSETFRLPSGRVVEGHTLNGATPGPTIRAREGDLVEVRLRNESVVDGVTLHWHGIDVPNAVDGVAGVTQDAVEVGGEFTYRFRVEDSGAYWYHSHQHSSSQVPRGLFGGVVIEDRDADGEVEDVLALVHTYGGERTVNGDAGDVPVDVEPGSRVRVRVVNTDNGPMLVWVGGAPYRGVAVDGVAVNRPEPVSGMAVQVTAGGRAELEIEVPDGGARVELGGSAALLLGGPGRRSSAPADMLDLLSYGAPSPLEFDPDAADRRFDYAIGRRPGFVRGKPGMWWSVNGKTFPDVPMFAVAEGDVVRVRISNGSGEVHPMHLHGHHMTVLSRDGVPATGSPWVVDSLNVAHGEVYEVAFVADNPGVWMFHCHHLGHAVDGLVAHIMYEGVTTPYLIGDGNEPE
jgi:FtsP/CotA-like multicopper oxidase with cupredoxin domain